MMNVMAQIVKGMAHRLGSEEAVRLAIFKEMALYDSRFVPDDGHTNDVIKNALMDEIVNIQSERYANGRTR